MDAVLSVRELTERLRRAVEQRFPYVWVRGEVTNLSRPQSGHVYFSLKEGDDVLACVWFRGQQKDRESFDPLTGEVWEGGPRPSLAASLCNGLDVVCAGRLSVYGARGVYQLVVDLAQESGQGALALAFEALKQKLAALGYFDAARKRPLPSQPARVALVTSPSGAAVRDFIRVAEGRGLGAEIRIHPVPVQGEEAPGRIAAALEEIGRQGWAEVAVLARGGGSLEDLWAFNDERVARAVFVSPVPVLTGVGHEIDHSIADFTADAAAATPSHAAQMLWMERTFYAQRADDADMALRAAWGQGMRRREDILAQAERALRLLSPVERLRRREEALDQQAARLLRALDYRLERAAREEERLSGLLAFGGERAFARHEARLAALEPRLAALDPRAPLARGYALVRDAGGRFVRSVGDAASGAALRIDVADGEIRAHVD